MKTAKNFCYFGLGIEVAVNFAVILSEDSLTLMKKEYFENIRLLRKDNRVFGKKSDFASTLHLFLSYFQYTGKPY